MYAIDDNESITADIQRYLTLISAERSDPNYLPENTEGGFDESTRSAVAYYQRTEGLDESGEVDQETFYSIYSDYLYYDEAVNRREKYPIDIAFPLGYGVSDKDMVRINTMLFEISEYYYGASDIRKNSYFSKNTENAVVNLRNVFGLEESEQIDEEFYLILSEEHYLINKHKENFRTAF